jgi:WD40 repeat protein
MIAQYKGDPEVLKRLCEDAKFCRNLLSDFCPGPTYKRQRELLVAVVADQGAAELYQSQNSDLDEAAVRRLIARMVDDHGFTDQAVTWAVESWILALGLYDLFPELSAIAVEENSLAKAYRVPAADAQVLPQSATSAFEVFISYRRKSEAESLARAIYLALLKKNIRAFLDVEDLSSIDFERELLKKVAETPTFLLVLSRNSLDRCAEPGDWVRREIVKALKTTRNIIPLMTSDFEFPQDQELPKPIRRLSRYSPRLRHSHELFNQVIDRIVEIVKKQREAQHPKPDPLSPPDNTPPGVPLGPGPLPEPLSLWNQVARRSPLLLLLLASAAIVAIVLYLAWLKSGSPDYSRFTLLTTLEGHGGSVQCIAFSPDGKRIASGNGNQTVTIWDISAGHGAPEQTDYPIIAVAYSPDGSSLGLLEGSTLGLLENGSMLIVKDVAGAEVRQRQRGVISFAFSPDSDTVAGLKTDGTVNLWDTKSGALKGTLPKYVDPTEKIEKEDHAAPVNLIAYSPDGKSLAAGVHSNVIIWDTESGQPRLLKRHFRWVNSLSFSPDGSTLASGGADEQVIVWDIASGQFRLPMKQNGAVTSVAFLPDSKRLIFWSDSKTLASVDGDGLKLWEVGTWSSKYFSGGNRAVGFAFSAARGTLALASGADIRIWGVR